MVDDINAGDVLAWSRHITGQDVNDPNSHDYFRSVAVIPGAGATPAGGTWHEDQVYVVAQRTVNNVTVKSIERFTPMDWGDDPNYCWFVDCALGPGTSSIYTKYQPGRAAIPAVPAIPAIPATYKLTYFSETAKLYGIPIGDGGMYSSLDAGGSARDVGGGIVGLPYTDHPFQVGQTILIAQTTNYNGTFVLTAGTTANELQFTKAYVAETFTGNEYVVRYITSNSGVGRMAVTSLGVIYYGHQWDGATYVTRIDPDDTKHGDFLTPPSWPFDAGDRLCMGVCLSSDDNYLYLCIQGRDIKSNYHYYVEKYNLTDGSNTWSVGGGNAYNDGGYDMDIDDDDNVYTSFGFKYDSTDGTKTQMVAHFGMADVAVSDEQGIVVYAGSKIVTPTYNISLRTLDNSAGGTILVDGSGYVGVSDVTFLNGYIYALMPHNYLTPPMLYKLYWNGSTLSEISSAQAPTYADGLYTDLYGNLVVINQDYGASEDDVFWFYDGDLNYLYKIENLWTQTLNSWDSPAGNQYYRGNAVILGDLGTPEVPGTPGTPAVAEEWFTATEFSDDLHLDGASVCVYADGAPRGTFVMDGNDITDFNEADYTVVIAGLNYYSVYESWPLNIGGQAGALGLGRQTTIQDVTVDFLETMGAHVGASKDYSADFKFSYDNWATTIEPYTGFKGPAPFVRGTAREPVVYIYEWDPVPMCIRSLYVNEEMILE